MKEWQTFVRRFSDMREGRRELFLKDLTDGKNKYDTKHVIANISRSEQNLNNPDLLWLRGESGEKDPQPWYILVQEILEESVPGKPWEDLLDMIDKKKMENQ